MMKVGDLVTYKQRADLQVFPCPWDRMGIILGIGPGRLKDSPDEFEVYWYGSENIVSWQEQALELINETR
jgi:hypothetical protein